MNEQLVIKTSESSEPGKQVFYVLVGLGTLFLFVCVGIWYLRH